MGDENSLQGRTQAHKHESQSSTGGFLETGVTGVTNLSNGSMVYGDASEIVTELTSGNLNDVLTMGATLPSWVAPSVVTSPYELVDTQTLGVDSTHITLSASPPVAGSAVSIFQFYFNGAVTGAGAEELRLRINGDSTSDYVTERLNVIGGVSSANTHTDTYFHLCPANASKRYFGSINIQVGDFGTSGAGAHFLYSGYISGSSDTTLSEVKIESFGSGNNIKDESCASLFKINI